MRWPKLRNRNFVEIDLQKAYVFFPWLAAGDLLSYQEQARIAAVQSDDEIKNFIAADLPTYLEEQEFTEEEMQSGKLAFQILLTITDPAVDEGVRATWPQWTRKYRTFSWLSFFKNCLTPFTFSEDKARILIHEIWKFCYPGEPYQVNNLSDYKPTNEPL